ncbi:hypothetical protein HanRHA438_Chr15g0693371 [Helianthus annuus]|nr:hypothetical protein HanRHA438_Chr15g0693371 [Helianthus annuus]
MQIHFRYLNRILFIQFLDLRNNLLQFTFLHLSSKKISISSFVGMGFRTDKKLSRPILMETKSTSWFLFAFESVSLVRSDLLKSRSCNPTNSSLFSGSVISFFKYSFVDSNVSSGSS